VDPYLSRAFEQGAAAARALFKYAEDEEKGPSRLRRALPYLAALGAAAGGYKYLRKPSFSTNPALRQLQETGIAKGFHRVVDTTPTTLAKGAPWSARIEHALKPRADAQGNLSRFNRLKMFLREGTTEAIPVSRRQVGNRWQEQVNNHTGPVHVDGTVWGREGVTGYGIPKKVHGGQDIEGDALTQGLFTRLHGQGKSYEAHLLQTHAPGASPETHTRYSGKSLMSLTDGLAEQTPSDAAALLQKRVQAVHGHDYMLKPDGGFASGVGGQGFPRSGKGDWGQDVQRLINHREDPHTGPALRAAESEGGNVLADYLRDNNLNRGHVLLHAMKEPDNMLLQKEIPNIQNEYRVHTIAGAVPKELILPRDATGAKKLRQLPARLGVGSRVDAVHAFAQDALSKLPSEYQKGNYAFDVVSHKKPDGSIGHQLIEMNATAQNSPDARGGTSGFLHDIGHRHYHAMTGRHTPLMAGLGSGAAGGAALLGTRALTGESDDDQEGAR